MADKIKKTKTTAKTPAASGKKSTMGKSKKSKVAKTQTKPSPKKVAGKTLPKKAEAQEVINKNALVLSENAADAKEKASLPIKKSGSKDPVKSLARELEKAADTDLATIEEEEEIDPEALNRGDNPMSLVDHLDEFRSRVLIILASLIILTIAGFSFSDYLIDVINSPFLQTGQKLNVFKLMGGFMIRLKASAVVALLLTIPLIFYHIWKFIVPAINKEDRMFSRLSLISAILLFYGGMAFVFFGLVPLALKVLIEFIPAGMLSTIGADDYFSFIIIFSIAMGILFELPIFFMILTRMGIVTPQFLIAKRKIAIVLCFVIAAIITPTQDPFSMSLVAVPLWFLYEISIVISRFILIRKKRKELKAAKSS